MKHFNFKLKRTRIGTRLILAFLIMASVGAGIGFVSSFELDRILDPLTSDIPQSLAGIKRTYHLDLLAQKIRHYDQILTEAAREFIYTGDRQYKYRYKEFEPRLETVIREAIEKGDVQDKKIFLDLRRSKALFVDIEYRAIRSVDESRMDEAKTILEGSDYWNLKREYRKTLDAYVERRGREYGDSLNFTSMKVDSLVAETYQLVQRSKETVFKFSMLAILVAVLLGVFITRTILKPIYELRRGAEFIGKGNLHHRIQIHSEDEIGNLAQTFNEMTQKLGEFYTGLESKVQEKTHELAKKVEESQNQNRALERTKEAMMNILEDLEHARLEAENGKAKYQAILSSIGDGMIATDANGCIMMVNAQAELMLGFESRSMVGKNIGAAYLLENEHQEKIAVPDRPVYQAIERRKKIASTAIYVRKDGTRFPAAVTVSPVVRNDKIIGAIEIFRDISKEKEIDRMKTEFISTVSHELRTPLTVVREGVSLVLDKILGPVTGGQTEFLSISLKEIDRLGRIINNLLDISKIESGKVDLKRGFINLTEAADDVIAGFTALAKNQGLELRKKYSSDSIPIYADKDKLIEVFTNLLGNALKFTEKGAVEISIVDEPAAVVCSVKDSGRGISEEDLKRVFGKFQQFGASPKGREKGTGLGLSIAKGIVELHQGRISVDSKFGEGTCFSFRLPKQTPKEVFSEHLTRLLRESVNDRSPIMLLSLQIPGDLTGMAEPAAERDLFGKIEDFIRAYADTFQGETLREGNAFYMLFPGIDRKESEALIKKLSTDLEEHFKPPSEEESGTFTFMLRDVHYPEDGSTGEELISSLRAA